MKLSYSIKALIRRDKIKADGTCPIYFFVRVAAVVTKIPSGKFILPGDWDDKNKCPKKTDQKLRNLGIILNKTVSGFETYMLAQEGMGRKVTLTVALNYFNQKSSVSLFQFWQEQMDLWKANKEHSTLKSYKSTLNVFRQFKPKADFGDLTPSLIDHFDNHMSVNRGNALGGRFTKHKCLKSIINQAIRKGYMTESPYRSFKIRAAEGKRMFLSIEEVKLIWP